MKLVSKSFEKDSSGHVTLIPDEAEDMWHAYNLIAVGDRLRSTTIRRVQTESATGSVSSNKIRTTLTLAVKNIEFDTQACVLRVNGRNTEENQFVKMGAYHTIDLELNRKFTLIKDHWDFIALDRVETACDPTQHADLAAIILHEGLCHICLVTSSMTVVRAKIDMNVPRKRKGYCAQHDKGLLKFYDAIIQGILRHINFDVVKCVLVGSPGFVKDQFFDYMIQQATKLEWKVLLENKSKFLLVHSSSGHKHALKEILSDSSIASRLADTKASSEVKALDTFYSTLQNEPDKAYYGIGHVEKANEAMAVETLLVTDKLFRSADLATRKRYVNLVESVKDNGGEVKIFSSLHVSGEQLGQLSGVAALLRFPMPDLADEEEEDDGSDSDQD
ncbi:protein pelota homolog [Exaiptasia diaphana]|uniref:Protein pelota homolog n=2 Tax=Exaiptasia diaphana TaxID=2652724 RepID=A0A913Y6E3_EXADI|nr:protein pelota homolog [Exaiptasia diaphana]KXJ21899.1 Protein pelota-like [Exaiptasia diaphana]